MNKEFFLSPENVKLEFALLAYFTFSTQWANNPILEKYAAHPYVMMGKGLLPVLTNQKSNAYLKEIADLCGIKKNLTTHLARHTFATTVTLTNGVPIESVGRMLGHRSLKTTQIYAKVLDTKLAEDMLPLKNRFKANESELKNLL